MYQISARLKIVCASYSDLRKVCEKNRNIRKKQRNFFESLIVRIWGMAEGIFGMWPPLSGGHLHSKFGAILDQESQSYGCVKITSFVYMFLSIYLYSVYTCPVFFGHMTHYRIS